MVEHLASLSESHSECAGHILSSAWSVDLGFEGDLVLHAHVEDPISLKP